MFASAGRLRGQLGPDQIDFRGAQKGLGAEVGDDPGSLRTQPPNPHRDVASKTLISLRGRLAAEARDLAIDQLAANLAGQAQPTFAMVGGGGVLVGEFEIVSLFSST